MTENEPTDRQVAEDPNLEVPTKTIPTHREMIEGKFTGKWVPEQTVELTGRELDDWYENVATPQRLQEEAELKAHLEKMEAKGEESAQDHYHNAMQDDTRYMDKVHEEALAENAQVDADKEATLRAEKERLASIEEKIKNDPKFRRLQIVAVQLALLRNHRPKSPEDDAKSAKAADYKEQQFTELFDELHSKGMDEDALEYILDHAYAETEEPAPSPQESPVEDESPQENKADAETTSPSQDAPEASESETPAPKERPDLSIKDDEEEDDDTIAPLDLPDEAAVKLERAKDVDESGDEKAVREKAKAWWNSRKENLKDIFTWWGTKYTMTKDWALNLGVKEGMSDEEIDKRRNRNRTIFILGTGALLGGAIAAIATETAIHVADGATAAGLGHGHDIAGHEFAAQHPMHEAPAPTSTPEITSPSSDYYNISDGEGGYRLFENLHLSDTQWNQFSQQLLERNPDDLYIMPSGGIGLAHPGWLSTNMQQDINQIIRTGKL